MGNQLLSLKGQSWRGKSLLHVSDRGARNLLKAENCYVSQDGSELRHWPGFACILDLSEDNNSSGYARYVVDGYLPIREQYGSSDYWTYNDFNSGTTTALKARAKPSAYFGFEQIKDTLVLFGESRFREMPIADVNNSPLTIQSVDDHATFGTWSITLNGTPSGYSASVANGLQVGDAVYVEDVAVADTAVQAYVDANLNGKQHEIKAISGQVVTLFTPIGGAISSTAVTAGSIHRTQWAYGRTYLTPSGNDPYSGTFSERPSDPDALTAWIVRDSLDLSAPESVSSHAWVANRQRDFGDNGSPYLVEGVYSTPYPNRGISRRAQLRLPYRPNPAVATDKIILAAPGYGCMFQIPLGVPSDPANSPPGTGTPAGTGDGQFGVPAWGNDYWDKPRALGVPKARVIVSSEHNTPQGPEAGPQGEFTYLQGFWGYYDNVSPQFWGAYPDPGDWKLAFSWYDAALNQEGPVCNPVPVTLPDTTGSGRETRYNFAINVLHPGYIMAECLALHLNVYIAEPGSDVLKYYMTLPFMDALAFKPSGGLYTPSLLSSANYGFQPTIRDDPHAMWWTFPLPLPNNTSDLASVLNPLRIAPQGANMPRGAEACRYIRGVLISGGAMGNVGKSKQLWGSYASFSVSSPDVTSALANSPNELYIRAYGDTFDYESANQDGLIQNTTLGIAGKAFPDAYQGIDVILPFQIPFGRTRFTIDQVLNHKARSHWDLNTSSPETLTAHFTSARYERLKLTETIPVHSRFPIDGTPTGYQVDIARPGEAVYYVMPQGQIQISDPGAPQRASKAAIQIVDPQRGDDIVAIGQFSGQAIICSRKETYTLDWNQQPLGTNPNLITNEFGCIAANSMVEFDGGLAWLSERGPVALGGGTLDFIGLPIVEEFYGDARRYLYDNRGMMRHSWGCHDQSRGLVMWGLATTSGSQVVEFEGTTYAYEPITTSDEILSRFPCDEVLVWSYRANAFTTWRPPAGLEIYWMRPLRDKRGNVRICFLAADGRIYALEDKWAEMNPTDFQTYEVTPLANGSGTVFQFSALHTATDGDYATGSSRGGLFYLRPGMVVDVLDDKGLLRYQTAIASVDTVAVAGGTSQITLTSSVAWKTNWSVRIGSRPTMTIVTTYAGAEATENMQVNGVQLRYSLYGTGSANVKVTGYKPDRNTTTNNTEARTVAITDASAWPNLGIGYTAPTSTFSQLGSRLSLNATVDTQELAIQLEIAGSAQTRIQDLALELGAVK